MARFWYCEQWPLCDLLANALCPWAHLFSPIYRLTTWSRERFAELPIRCSFYTVSLYESIVLRETNLPLFSARPSLLITQTGVGIIRWFYEGFFSSRPARTYIPYEGRPQLSIWSAWSDCATSGYNGKKKLNFIHLSCLKSFAAQFVYSLQSARNQAIIFTQIRNNLCLIIECCQCLLNKSRSSLKCKPKWLEFVKASKDLAFGSFQCSETPTTSITWCIQICYFY